jgi:bacteriorhodopsin
VKSLPLRQAGNLDWTRAKKGDQTMLAATRTLSSKTKTVTRTATLAMAAVTYFALAIVALHVLRPDHNPISRPTSEYAVGPYGFLMTTAFFSMSVASWALVIGLQQGLAPSARSRIGLGLLALWAVGVSIAMLFPIDLDGAPPTLAGTIHAINGPLTFLGLTIGVLLVSRRFKHDERWRPFYRSALLLSLLMLVEFVGVPLAMVTASGLAGLAQRIFLVTFVTWFLLTAARLRASAIQPA